MEKEKETKLSRCKCGEPNPALVKLRAGNWLCACQGCPTHVYGDSAETAIENWEREVRPRDRAGKGN